MLTIYSKATGCSKCDLLHNVLRHEGVEFQTILINEGIAEMLKEFGFSEAPVISPGGPLTKDNYKRAFSGFDPDEIEKLLE